MRKKRIRTKHRGKGNPLFFLIAVGLVFFTGIFPLSGHAEDSPPKKKSTPLSESESQKIRKALELDPKGVWLGVRSEGQKKFENKVTLLYFWEYTTINCLRDLSYLRHWYEKYHPYGLEIISVHTPEFKFAANRENVEAARKRLGIPFPVFLDNDGQLWDRYRNRSWPTKYLVNPKGRIVYSQVGEGHYGQMEKRIRRELQVLRSETVMPGYRETAEKDLFDHGKCGEMTSELYVGFRRAGLWGIEIANPEGILPDQKFLYKDKGTRFERGFFVEGLWVNREEYFEHARTTELPLDYLGIIYMGHEVYAVLSRLSGNDPLRVFVLRDDWPVAESRRGRDLHEDERGNTYVDVLEPRLYYLISNEDVSFHQLKLLTAEEGLAVFSFAFSNRCLSEFDHL